MARAVWRSVSVSIGCLALVVGACSPVSPASSSAAVPSVAASAAPSVRPSAARPVVRVGDPWIAFQQFSARSEVMLVRPDGSDLHSPTSALPGGDRTNPDWSPDGSMLVFAVGDGARDDLWVVRTDGTGARLLADCEGDCVWLDDPAWSPDGRHVLFTRTATRDGASVGSLERIDVGSGTVTLIQTAAPKHFYAGARWSPDGRSVVLEVLEFASASVDSDIVDVSLAIIDLARPTAAGRALTERGTFPETAAWQRDGGRIVFAARPAPGAAGTDLFEIRPNGSGLRRLTNLTNEGGSATHPDVSADGTAIVFTAQRPGEGRTVLGQVNGSGGTVRSATGATYLDGVHPRLRPGT